MKISYNWLKQHITSSVSVNQVVEYLTDTGLEVEKIQNIETKFRTGQEKLQVDLEQTQRTEFSKIEKIVNDAITEYAESNDFDIILRADGTTLYAKKYINVTEDIISKLQ